MVYTNKNKNISLIMGYKKTSTQQNKKKKENRAPVKREVQGTKFAGFRTDLQPDITPRSRRVHKGKGWELQNKLFAMVKREEKIRERMKEIIKETNTE